MPLPLMFTPKDYDNTVIGNFLKKKHFALSELIGKPESLYFYYSMADFQQLIDAIAGTTGAGGIRVYFADYALSGVSEIDALVQSGYKDMLTLIFSVTDADMVDLGAFFIIKPGGGVLPLSLDGTIAMVTAYQKLKIPFLQEIIYQSGITDFMETKSMWYSLEKFNGSFGILKEMTDQGADGITVFIGSYAKDYTISDGSSPMRVGWQLTIVLELTKIIRINNVNYHYHFDIEDTGGFCERPPCPIKSKFRLIPTLPPPVTIKFDTNIPCPPASGCTGSSVPPPTQA